MIDSIRLIHSDYKFKVDTVRVLFLFWVRVRSSEVAVPCSMFMRMVDGVCCLGDWWFLMPTLLYYCTAYIEHTYRLHTCRAYSGTFCPHQVSSPLDSCCVPYSKSHKNAELQHIKLSSAQLISACVLSPVYTNANKLIMHPFFAILYI